jgi:hypothetical protein
VRGLLAASTRGEISIPNVSARLFTAVVYMAALSSSTDYVEQLLYADFDAEGVRSF